LFILFSLLEELSGARGIEPNIVGSHCESDEQKPVGNHAETCPTLFAIVEAIVVLFNCERVSEYASRGFERNAMLSVILGGLALLPLENIVPPSTILYTA
jgi:hypothetical protein